MDISISDVGKGYDFVSIEAYQSGSLVLGTKILSNMVSNAENKTVMGCLARATVLMGAAALEALLCEVAYIEKPTIYKREYLKGGIKDKIELLKGKEFIEHCNEAIELWDYRKALAHSEPINERSLFVGNVINVDGAQWVYKTVEDFARKIWINKIPMWFSETTGIYND